jgi:hypothetical protein
VNNDLVSPVYPVLTKYRAMFASLFQHLYGLQIASVQRIFAGVHPMELGLVQARAARVFTGEMRMHGWSFDVAGRVLP